MSALAAVGLALMMTGQDAGATEADFWRGVFEGKAGILATGKVSAFPGVDLARPLLNCDRLRPISNRPVAALSLEIDLGGGRHPTLDVWISELPPGARAHETVLVGGKRNSSDVGDNCVLSLRGLSLIQIGRYWIGFPTLCRRGYYKSAVATALAGLKSAFPSEFPREFIFSPCGAGRVAPSLTADFLKMVSPARPRRRAD